MYCSSSESLIFIYASCVSIGSFRVRRRGFFFGPGRVWLAAGGAAVASRRSRALGGALGCPPQGTGPGFERALKRAARLVSRALGSVEPLWLRLRRGRVLGRAVWRRE